MRNVNPDKMKVRESVRTSNTCVITKEGHITFLTFHTVHHDGLCTIIKKDYAPRGDRTSSRKQNSR